MDTGVIGKTLSHYRVLSKLGKGGMGEVFLAKDTVLGRTVALKILPAHLASDALGMQRFVQEAKTASLLNHPNIATIHEMCEADGVHFIAMEYVEGQTLRERIDGHPLGTVEILNIATQITEALAAAHTRGIIHRDIKSANIMVTPQGR